MTSFIHRLPEALVQSILQDWVRLSDVCRVDSAVCNNTERGQFVQLMQKPKFVLHETCLNPTLIKDPPEKIADWAMKWIFLRGINTSVLVLCPYLTEHATERAEYLQNHGHVVTEVRMVHYSVGVVDFARTIRDLCEYCPDVTVVVFAAHQHVLNYAVVQLIAHSWKKLTWLSIGRCESKVDLSPIAEHCQALEKIECFFMTTSAAFQQKAWQKFFSVCPRTLRVIILRSTLKPAILQTIAARCPLLQQLLVGLELADDASFKALAAGCPLMNTLCLTNNTRLTAEGLVAITRNHGLTTLSFYNVPGMTDEAMVGIAENSPLLEDVRGDCVNLPELTDATLVALGKHCPKLKALWLTRFRNYGITEVGFNAIAAGCPLLERLLLDGKFGAGAGVVALARGCPRLRVVRLYGVTAEGVRALAEHCPLLEAPDLTGRQVDDGGVLALVQRCPEIRHIVLKDTAATERGLCAIAEYCRNLTSVTIGADILGEGRGEEVRAIFPAEVEVMLL